MGTFSPRAAVSTDLPLLYVSASYHQSQDWLNCTIFTQDEDFGYSIISIFNQQKLESEKI